MAKIPTKLDYTSIEFFTKLDPHIVELQKKGISLIILRKRAEGWIFCTKRAFAHFGHISCEYKTTTYIKSDYERILNEQGFLLNQFEGISFLNTQRFIRLSILNKL